MSPIRSTFVSTTAVIVAAFAVVAMMSTTSRQVEAFAPLPTPRWTVGGVNQQIVNVRTLNMGFFSDEERKALTRDSEPEDYFQTYVVVAGLVSAVAVVVC